MAILSSMGDAVPDSGAAVQAAGPRLAWYGDDFTGATDTLATVAQAGLRAMLFLDVPTPAQLERAGPLDALGIAGIARALDPDELRRELLPVGRFMAELAPRVLHYKMCSTFDSAPHVGNLYTAMQTLRPFVQSAFLPILGGQPSLGRYCVFSHLFARAGAQGAVHRIDRHPTMARHPITPMDESDLRLHLARQGLALLHAVHYPDYALGAAALEARLAALPLVEDLQPVLLDVATPENLELIGGLIWRRAQRERLLAVGASSVAQALISHWGLRQESVSAAVTPASAAAPGGGAGPTFLFAGSLSPVTAGQLRAAQSYRRIHADADRLIDDMTYRDMLLLQVATSLTEGVNTLVYTQPDTLHDAGAPGVDTGRAAQLAQASAGFVARVQARMALIAPLRRIGIAGGDTSSHVTRSLGLWGLSYADRMAAGVTLCRMHSDDPTLDGAELMLKGGQVGPEDLFDRFASRCGR